MLPPSRGAKGLRKSSKNSFLSTWQILFLVGLCVQLYLFGGAARRGSENKLRATSGLSATGVASEERAVTTGRDGARRIATEKGEDFNSEELSGEEGAGAMGVQGLPAASPSIPTTCTLEVIGGREKDGYGAWTLCGDRLKAGGVVYSFGIGGDVSFDNDLVERGLTVYGFDPTIEESKVKNVFRTNHHKEEIPKGFIFRQLGLAATDGVVTFFQSRNSKIHSKTAVALSELKVNYRDGGFQAAVLRFKTFRCMLGHPWVDVLKMDVEGVEMDICLSDEFRNWPIPADQILIEFHERMMKDGKAKKAECLNVLRLKGFRPVHTSVNKQEIAFARLPPGVKVNNPKHI